MIKQGVLTAAVLAVAACARQAPTSQLANPGPGRPSLATNLSGPADWNTEIPFVDMFRFSREWISQQDGKDWGQGPRLDIDAKGWVKRLEPGCWAETFVASYDKHYPSGDYTVLYDGKGELDFGAGGPQGAVGGNGRYIVHVDSTKGHFAVRLMKTDPSDPVRNIRVLIPGSEKTYRENPFNPTFLARWKGVSALRFMDWMQTNGSKVKTWSERPRLDDANWCAKGVPVELMVDLANRLQADAWFCIPVQADDDYVRQFAGLVQKSLDQRLRVYVELSNEVWNPGFDQSTYAEQQGAAAHLGDGFENRWRWYALRSSQVFAAWNQTFPRPRTVRVLAAQAGWIEPAKQILAFRDAAKSADVLAIAPYVGYTPSPSDNPSADEVAGWTADQVFGHLRDKVFPAVADMVKGHKALADKYGLALVAYEGGQHLVGIQGAENNDRLTELFTSVNRDPRMGKVYDDYLKLWQKSGGGLFANFSSVSSSSKWGSWGAMEYADGSKADSPKYAALMRWAAGLGQKVP
ncbi:MAG: hypothetical protein KF857_03100 [Fimbriimonadaceae bacterium]|nr:hypothetical protein [Fimbriimonadaceae bacterium]